MNALSLYLQVGLSLALGRLAWQALRIVVVDRASGPSASLASKLAHGIFALALALPLLMSLAPNAPLLPERLERARDAGAGAEIASTGSPSATGFTLLGRGAKELIPPEVRAALPSLAGLALLPFVFVAAVRTGRQWLWLRRVLARAPCIRRVGRVRVLCSEEVDTPFSTAALGGAHVVLPRSLLRRSEDRALVLRHELHHHRRRDVWWALLLDALRVVFAWNPAVHSWALELSDWQERACDAELVDRGAPLRAYAGCLLRVAEQGLRSPLPVASAAMARPNGRCALKRRIEMLLDTKTRSRRLGAPGAALTCALAALLATGTWAVAAALPSGVSPVPPSAIVATTPILASLPSPQETALPVGSLAPDLTLADGRGERTSLSELRGRVVVLDFWADWCRFCSDAVPALRTLETDLDTDELAIVGISVDDTREAFEHFLAKHDLDWPQLHASGGMKGEIARSYGVRALPLHVVLDRQGRVAASGVTLAQLRPTIEALLEADRGSLVR